MHWTASTSGVSGRGADQFGSGAVFAYNAASDTFTVTPPGGSSTTFVAADFQSAPSNATTRVFANAAGQLTLSYPTIAGVPLSYTQTAFFSASSGSSSSSWFAVGGVPTVAGDMPRTGSATYTAETGANVVAPAAGAGNAVYATTTGTSATFSANFGSGTVATSVHLVAAQSGIASAPATDFGTFTGTGTISSSGPGFSGTFAGTTGAGFSGAFFGPQAAEAAYTYNFVSGSMEAFGATRAVKP